MQPFSGFFQRFPAAFSGVNRRQQTIVLVVFRLIEGRIGTPRLVGQGEKLV
jgi:hypothetical protein